MSNISLDISGKIDKPYIRALQAISNVASTLNIPFFIIGAAARDFLLEHCYGIKAPRMTLDLDLAIKVETWDKYDELINGLIVAKGFTKLPQKQRLQFETIQIDIIPFGQKDTKDFQIKWPPEYEVIMNMLGFEEVYQSSINLRLSRDPILDVRSPTLAGLSILKLLSWEEKYPERKKDAEDLRFIMDKYERAGNRNRLFDNELELLKSEDYDLEWASIKLLGKDMVSICDQQTLYSVKRILLEETEDASGKYKLVRDMMRDIEDFDNALKRMLKLKEGFDILSET